MTKLEELQTEVALSGKSSYSDVIDRLNDTVGIELDDEYPDTNGWQIEYVKHFTFFGTPMCLKGSMYYGTYSISENRRER